MKIEELQTVALAPAREISGQMNNDEKSRSHYTRELIRDLLAKNGWQPVGGGSFAEVFGNEKYPYVLKIFEAGDHAYRAYIDLSKSHSSYNPYFPKFRGNPMSGGGVYMIIRVEKLRPLEGTQYHSLKNDFRAWEIAEFYGEAEDLDGIDPYLLEAFHLINKMGKRFDLHGGNIMKRADGHVVLIDPVWNGSHIDGASGSSG